MRAGASKTRFPVLFVASVINQYLEHRASDFAIKQQSIAPLVNSQRSIEPPNYLIDSIYCNRAIYRDLEHRASDLAVEQRGISSLDLAGRSTAEHHASEPFLVV